MSSKNNTNISTSTSTRSTSITSITKEKLEKRIQDMFEYESDTFLANINLQENISSKLFNYQLLHLLNLITNFRSNKVLLDGSDTGTGKTYTTVALSKQLKLKLFVICPKTVVSKWSQVCDYFGVKPLYITNYESTKKTEFLEFKDGKYIWNVPKSTLLVFDEAHKCKNPKTNNAKLLISSREVDAKLLLVSATISDTPKSFAVFGYMLGFYSSLAKSRGWIEGMLRQDRTTLSSNISSINKKIYPYFGSRVTIEELGDKFPENQVCADCYDLDSKIKEEALNKALQVIKNSTRSSTSGSGISKNQAQTLVEINAARHTLELSKLEIFENLIEEYLENNYNVVVFVNFLDTLEKLYSKYSDIAVKLHGKLSSKERDDNIKLFQDNNKKIIICTMKTGSQSIDLHDLHGTKRVSLISPTYSSIDLIQALGRIYRAGAKTPALQRIVYTSNTYEVNICSRVNQKIKFLNSINDTDLLDL